MIVFPVARKAADGLCIQENAASEMAERGSVMLDCQRRRTPAFFALIALPATAMGFALSVQISALSWILATRYHLDIDEIGLVWAAGPLAGLIGQGVVCLLSARVWLWKGRRRVFVVIGRASGRAG